MELLKKGNHKLSKKIGIWTLPRTTCVGAGECAKFCYAKIFETMPQVKAYRINKLQKSKSLSFVSEMVKEIKDNKVKKLRIHESGDFYNQGYLNKWKEIANQCKGTIFLTYTKSFNLNLDTPENFILFQSYGSKWDDKIDTSRNTAIVVKDVKDKPKGYYLCPYGQENFKKCLDSCKYCYSKKGIKHVAFLLHSHKKR
jgi:ferredoxin